MSASFAPFGAARRGVVTVAVSLFLLFGLTAAGKRTVKKPAYDPNAAAVGLFEGMDEGLLEVTVIARSAQEANLFVENKSDRPLSVKLPPAVAAVHVLKQILPPGGTGSGFNPNNGLAGANGNGPAQTISGGPNTLLNNRSMNGFNLPTNSNNRNGGPALNNFPGAAFFSVKPEKTAQVPLATVCLSHGKPDPRPNMTYKLVRLEEYTKDPALQELLKRYGTEGGDPQAAQAAAWHLANGMSWKTLETKLDLRLGPTRAQPYFNARQLQTARELVEKAQERAKEASNTEKTIKL